MALDILSLLCTFESFSKCIKISLDQDSFSEYLEGQLFCVEGLCWSVHLISPPPYSSVFTF